MRHGQNIDCQVIYFKDSHLATAVLRCLLPLLGSASSRPEKIQVLLNISNPGIRDRYHCHQATFHLLAKGELAMLELGILFSSSFGVRGRFSFSGVVLLQREDIELLETYQE